MKRFLMCAVFFLAGLPKAHAYYDAQPVYYNTKKLPAFYDGNDPVALFNALNKHFADKGDFETRAQYNSRLYRDKKARLIGSLTSENVFATRMDTSDAMTGDSLITSYNADKQELKVRLWEGTEEQKMFPVRFIKVTGNLYRKSNAYGAETDVLHQDYYSVFLLWSNSKDFGFSTSEDGIFSNAVASVYVPRYKARTTKANVRVMAIYKVIDPYTYLDVRAIDATFSNPIEGKREFDYIKAQIQELWLYNYRTGEILKKIRPVPKKRRK